MELKVLKDWQLQIGEETNIFDYISNTINPENVYLMGKYIFFPDISRFKEGFFLRERISEDVYNTWFYQLKGNISDIEKMINHVHVYDLFGHAENISDEVFLEIGKQIALSWKMYLQYLFPSNSFIVDFNDGSDDYGPTVTFYQKYN